MAFNTLFKKDIVVDSGKLTAKQRRFAYTSLTHSSLYGSVHVVSDRLGGGDEFLQLLSHP
ncbi:MAG: hypothetical protein U0X93_08130 [Anaerolineales bacterium]